MNEKNRRRRDTLVAGYKARLQERTSRANKLADWMTASFGTPGFLFGNALFFILWVLCNAGVFGERLIFDPFPYNFLTMTVSLEAIFLAIIVLMSQNRAAKITEMREEMDFEINLRAEAEVTKILTMLDEMHDHMGLENSNDTELDAMKEKIDIMKIKEEIERANKY